MRKGGLIVNGLTALAYMGYAIFVLCVLFPFAIWVFVSMATWLHL